MSDTKFEIPKAELFLISFTAFVSLITLLFIIGSFWHNSVLDQTKTFYETRIAAFQDKIEALEKTGSLDPRSATGFGVLFDEIKDARRADENWISIPWLITWIGSVILVFLLSYRLKIRNRATLKATYKSGALAGGDVEASAEEFIKNYVQKGGE